MIPLHPILSSLPKALVCLVLVLELVSLKGWIVRSSSMTRFIIWTAAVVIIASYISGSYAVDTMEACFKISEDPIEKHEFFGKLSLVFLCITLILFEFSERAALHVAAFKRSYLASLIILCGFILFTSYLGGDLVFGRGAGVFGTCS